MRYSQRVDCAFRKLFNSEKNEFLKSFVNSVLPPDEQLVKLTLMDPDDFEEDWKDKYPLLYIKGIDKEGRYYNIEMQVNDDKHFDKRSLYHCMALFQGTFSKEFKMAHKTISIHVMNFDRFKGEGYHHIYHLSNRRMKLGEEEKKKEKIEEDLDFCEIHLVVLEKFIETMSEMKSKLDHWMYFLATADKYEEDNIPELFRMDEDLRTAHIALKNLKLDDKEEEIYERQLKELRDREKELGKNLEMEIEKVVSSSNLAK
jgi:predicted transposase/invertase (TIGR01784 family)